MLLLLLCLSAASFRPRHSISSASMSYYLEHPVTPSLCPSYTSEEGQLHTQHPFSSISQHIHLLCSAHVQIISTFSDFVAEVLNLSRLSDLLISNFVHFPALNGWLQVFKLIHLNHLYSCIFTVTPSPSLIHIPSAAFIPRGQQQQDRILDRYQTTNSSVTDPCAPVVSWKANILAKVSHSIYTTEFYLYTGGTF